MATRVESVLGDLYEEDFYLWTERQAEQLRARRFAEVDMENLTEEVEALGRSELNAVVSDAGGSCREVGGNWAARGPTVAWWGGSGGKVKVGR